MEAMIAKYQLEHEEKKKMFEDKQNSKKIMN